MKATNRKKGMESKVKKAIALVLSLMLILTSAAALAEGTLTFSWWGDEARPAPTQ